jgi:hypothetical protein
MHLSKVSKLLITILAVGFVVWLGGNVVRNAIAYDVFVPGTALEVKNWYSDIEKLSIVSVFRIASFYTIVGYAMTIVSSIALFIMFKKYFKTKGWLLMSFILIFLTIPVELFLIYYDLKIILAFNDQLIKSFEDKIVQDYFIGRFSKLTIPATMSFLSAIAAALIAIWRPLDKPYLTDKENISKN